jgi:hypothetical protein
MLFKTKFLLLTIGIIFMLKKDSTPRGIRNNNPLNIRESKDGGDLWSGEHELDLDADFEEFTSAEYGIRAAVKLFETYRTKYGLDTIAGIVSRWAPPNENKTSRYVQSVAQKTGIHADIFLTQEDYPALLKAMIYHENGQQPYSDDVINEGIRLALS